MLCSAVIKLGAHFLHQLQDCSQAVSKDFSKISKLFSNKLSIQANLQSIKHESDFNTLTHVHLLCFTLFLSVVL